MLQILTFIAVAALLAYLSRGALVHPRSHGFPRFFAFIGILAMVLRNLPVWDVDPTSPRQWVSWALLATSIGLVASAFPLLRAKGRPAADRGDPALFPFEKTTALVTSGIYRHIRHPMYASLLCLAWGAFLKDPDALNIAIVSMTTVCLWMTAVRDEAECLAYFGSAYREYMRGTKRFVPMLV